MTAEGIRKENPGEQMFLDTAIAELDTYGVSQRAINALDEAGYIFIKHLRGVSAAKLEQSLPNFGPVMTQEIVAAIRQRWLECRQ